MPAGPAAGPAAASKAGELVKMPSIFAKVPFAGGKPSTCPSTTLPSRKHIEEQLKEKYNVTFKVRELQGGKGTATGHRRDPQRPTHGQKGKQAQKPRATEVEPVGTPNGKHRGVQFAETVAGPARPEMVQGPYHSLEDAKGKAQGCCKPIEGQQRFVLERLQTHMRVAAQTAAEAWEAGGLLRAQNAKAWCSEEGVGPPGS
jgi:hypothetical protein